LLQLFFADLEPTAARLAIAREQLEVHRAQLAEYEAGQRTETGRNGSVGVTRSLEHWRGVTLPMGLLYERAAVEFWGGVEGSVAAEETAADRSRAEDDGAPIAPNGAAGITGGRVQAD
jgi:hypothetical protein